MRQILLHKQQPTQAQVEFEKAIALGADPHHVIADLATALYSQSQYQALLGLDKKILPATSLRADAAHSTQSLPLSASLKQYSLIRASAWSALGKNDTAINELSALLSSSDTNTEVLLAMLTIYVDEHDIEQAQRIINQVAPHAKTDPQYWYLRGRWLSLQQDYVSAIAAYQQSLQLDDQKSATYKAIANAYIALERFESASDMLEHALAISANDPFAIYMQSTIMQQTNQLQASTKALDYISHRISMIDDNSKKMNPQLLLIDAMASYSGENWQQSVRKFTSYLDNNPSDLNAVVLLAKIYQQTGQSQQAFDLLTAYHDQLAGHQEYALVLASAYIQQDNLQAAQQLLQQRLVANQSDVPALLLLTSMSYSVQEYAQSLRYVDRLLVESSVMTDAHLQVVIPLLRAQLLQHEKRYAEALAQLDALSPLIISEHSAHFSPNVFAKAQIMRVKLLHALKRTEERDELFDKLNRQWAEQPRKLVYLANMQLDKNHLPGAKSSTSQAVKALMSVLEHEQDNASQQFNTVNDNRVNMQTLTRLAPLSRQVGQADEVSHLLTLMQQRYPKRVYLLEVHAEHLLASGKYNQAIAHYNQLLASPVTLPSIKQSIALNNLGYLYTQTAQYALAIEHARQALVIRDDIPDFYDTLGWALSQSGQYGEARVYLEKALALAADSAEIQAHLAYTIGKIEG